MNGFSILLDFAVGCVPVGEWSQCVLFREDQPVQEHGQLSGLNHRAFLIHAQLQHLLHVVQFSVVLLERLHQVDRGFAQKSVGLQRVVAPYFKVHL